ncbi:MAG: FmdE, Molybdenum formylmethanofuran dehydrogenase operon [Chloroflexi bacterium ADurb.Bin325]|nr:MAG: FmdE, Molybdenum formylmethanofuran dehydrogenase operon [Chloroflexi bacterium ADurb.Bin325]
MSKIEHSINDDLKQLLQQAAARHSHLCPRQVLGVRIGLAGAAALGLPGPRRDKRLLVILETDGCFADGVETATGCTVGHRTLRVEDYGKIAATFIDVKTEQALRIIPRLDVRQRAAAYAPGETRRYFAQLAGYQVMPDEELLAVQTVQLTRPAAEIVSRPGVRVNCATCGEEIVNEREVLVDGRPLCHACAYGGYYATSIALPVAQIQSAPRAEYDYA